MATLSTPEYSFIPISNDQDNCNIVLGVSDLKDLSFPVFISGASAATVQIYIIDTDGNNIKSIGSLNLDYGINFITFKESINVADNTCFRIKIIADGINYYSCPFQFNTDTSDPLVKFRSSSDKYIEFDGNIMSLRLPIELKERNVTTEREEYIDSNGIIRYTYATRRGVWRLETNYLPLDFHKKMELMLLSDYITIDDISVVETAEYTINYKEKILHPDGGYIYKATTEMSEQDPFLIRNY